MTSAAPPKLCVRQLLWRKARHAEKRWLVFSSCMGARASIHHLREERRAASAADSARVRLPRRVSKKSRRLIHKLAVLPPKFGIFQFLACACACVRVRVCWFSCQHSREDTNFDGTILGLA